jgi:LAO/AO transport system kinase
MTAHDWLDKLHKGETNAFAKALTLTESSKEEDQQVLREIVKLCSNKGKALRIGITGVPGVGKSTFIDELGTYLCNDLHKKIAVLAIDPSSSRSGGSILGDKTRMEKLSRNERAFIRPIPSRNQLGGVASGLADAILLSEEVGNEIVIVETVGVGQSEVEVSKLVDIIVFLVLPNSGDDLQGIKRGIMEEVHVLVINKNDGEHQAAALKSKMNLDTILQIMPSPIEHEKREVFLCSSTENKGIVELWKAIELLAERMKNSGVLQERRQQQQQELFQNLLQKNILAQFYKQQGVEEKIKQLSLEIEHGKLDAYSAVKKLL